MCAIEIAAVASLRAAQRIGILLKDVKIRPKTFGYN